MKRTWIIVVGTMLIVCGYLWIRKFADKPPRPHPSGSISITDVGRPRAEALQPGLSFFQNIDEVRFTYARSFDPQIEITARRPYFSKDGPPILEVVITELRKPRSEGTTRFEKKISEEVFAELRGYVVRKDIIYGSLAQSESGLDGSTWVLEGKKGEFLLRHLRWCPQDTADEAFIAIGKRFLDLAEIKIPNDKFY